MAYVKDLLANPSFMDKEFARRFICIIAAESEWLLPIARGPGELGPI